MGLFDTKCQHCLSVEHATADCPSNRGFFNFDTQCRHCGSREHASNDCPQDNGIFFNETECRHCKSKEHPSKSCPHDNGFFTSETKCRHCGSRDHASKNCPHDRSLFSTETECRHCGGKNHSSSNCPHKKDENAIASVIGWLIAFIAIVYFVVWLFVNIVVPIVLLNLALIFTIFSMVKRNRFQKLFAVVAIVGGIYMFLDIINGWSSANFVKNVVKDKSWITMFVYINSAAIGFNTWYLVSPFWDEAKCLAPSEMQKRNLLIVGIILIVAISTSMIPFLYSEAYPYLFH